MVVVVGRVGSPHTAHAILDIHLLQEVGIGREESLLFVVQAIETHILQGSRTTGRSKGVGLRSLHGNLTPLGLCERSRTTHRHAALIELLAVTQDVLADFAEVDIEVAAIAAGILLVVGIDEGVHQPELDILHVGLLEVVGVELTHHTTPTGQRAVEQALRRHICRQVIRATLLGIVGQVKDGQRIGGTAIGRLVAVGIYLIDIDGTHIVVGELLDIALDMAGRQTAGAIGEQRVDGVPRQQGTVVAAGNGRLVLAFREHAGHAGEDPRRRIDHGDAVLGILEVIDIGGIVLRTTGSACYEVGKLARKGNL